MESLQLKVTRLENLWSCLGDCLDSHNIGNKLEGVLRELDKVIEYEEWRMKLLVADIDDVMASIEYGCQILGISLETLLTSNIEQGGMDRLEDWEFYAANAVMRPTLERKKYLTLLNNRLANEIRQRRIHVKEWLLDIDTMCKELDVSHSFGPYKSYYDDLSWGTVQKISCTLRDLTQKHATNKSRFESFAYSIHYYRTVLGETINKDDPIDIALHNLCNSISSISNQHFDMSQPPPPSLSTQPNADFPSHNNNAFLYYRHPLAYPLSLNDDLITNLQNKAHDLQRLYDTRYGQFNLYVNNIRTLWEELQIPNEKRCTIYQSLHKENLDKLQQNSDEMKTIVHVMIDEYIDTLRPTLEKLWDNALLTQNERNEFLETLYLKSNTMDTARAIMEKHMVYLEYIQSSSQTVDKIMKERKDLILKMINFETSASDPKRLFQASFQLIEEERWRKTCFPTLLQLDDALIKAVQEFEDISEKHFLVGNRRYLDILLDEIADRTANQTFFGFLNTEPNHDRPVRTKPRPNSLYASTQSVSISTTTTTTTTTADNKKSKTLTLSESPTQNISFTDMLPPPPHQRASHSNNLNRRSLPNGISKAFSAKEHMMDSPMPIPSTSTKPRKLPQNTNKNRLTSSQSITTLPTPNIIPQQYKSKSYQVSRSKSTVDLRQNNKQPSKINIENNNNNTTRIGKLTLSTNDQDLALSMDHQDNLHHHTLHDSPPVSPVISTPPAPPPRSKASQIPIRKYQQSPSSSTSNQSPLPSSSPETSSPTQQQQQQQQPTVQCV